MKRYVALLLAVVLVFGMIPTSAMAYGWANLKSTIQAAINEGTRFTTARPTAKLIPIVSRAGSDVATSMAEYYFDSAEKGYAYCSEHLKNVPAGLPVCGGGAL